MNESALGTPPPKDFHPRWANPKVRVAQLAKQLTLNPLKVIAPIPLGFVFSDLKTLETAALVWVWAQGRHTIKGITSFHFSLRSACYIAGMTITLELTEHEANSLEDALDNESWRMHQRRKPRTGPGRKEQLINSVSDKVIFAIATAPKKKA